MNRLLLLIIFLLVSNGGSHADEPVPTVPRKATQLESRVRSLLLKSSKLHIQLDPYRSEDGLPISLADLSRKELQPFVDSFFLGSQKLGAPDINTGPRGVVEFQFHVEELSPDTIIGATVLMGLDDGKGSLFIYRQEKNTGYTVHPITVKRWIQLLRAHQIAGAKLRQQAP